MKIEKLKEAIDGADEPEGVEEALDEIISGSWSMIDSIRYRLATLISPEDTYKCQRCSHEWDSVFSRYCPLCGSREIYDSETARMVKDIYDPS